MVFSTRVADYIAQGTFANLPLPATMIADIAPGVTAWYYATDTTTLYIWNQLSGAWDAIGTTGGGVSVLPILTARAGVAGGSPQDIVVPQAGIVKAQIWVFINGLKQDDADWSYNAGTHTATVTPNTTGDAIEVWSPVGGTVVTPSNAAIPPIAGNGTKTLKVKADESGLEWV